MEQILLGRAVTELRAAAASEDRPTEQPSGNANQKLKQWQYSEC